LIKTTNYTSEVFSLILSPLSVKVFLILPRKKHKIGTTKKNTKQKNNIIKYKNTKTIPITKKTTTKIQNINSPQYHITKKP
jgi:spore maturation protein SpmA